MGDMSMYFRMIDSLVARSDDLPPGYATRKQVNHLSILSFTAGVFMQPQRGHPLVHSLVYSLVHLPIQLSIHSFTCPFTHALVHSPVHPLITCPFTRSCLIHSCNSVSVI